MNVIDIKDIKEAKMKVKRLAFVLLSIATFSTFSACNNDPIDSVTPTWYMTDDAFIV
jgi:hypothetical protein